MACLGLTLRATCLVHRFSPLEKLGDLPHLSGPLPQMQHCLSSTVNLHMQEGVRSGWIRLQELWLLTYTTAGTPAQPGIAEGLLQTVRNR